MIVRCMVAGVNGNCEADFYFIKVECTKDQYDLGKHYQAAEDAAWEEGYEVEMSFDENEPAGKAILDKFVWESASIIEIEE